MMAVEVVNGHGALEVDLRFLPMSKVVVYLVDYPHFLKFTNRQSSDTALTLTVVTHDGKHYQV
jgi:hypothetical protein